MKSNALAVGHRLPRGPNPLAGLLTTAEVAAMKGVNERWVRYCIGRGILPAWRIAEVYLVPLREVEAWQTGVHPRSAAQRNNGGEEK